MGFIFSQKFNPICDFIRKTLNLLRENSPTGIKIFVKYGR